MESGRETRIFNPPDEPGATAFYELNTCLDLGKGNYDSNNGVTNSRWQHRR
jgi:hypothetical protein